MRERTVARMGVGRADVQIERIRKPVARRSFQTVDPRLRGVGDVRQSTLEAGNLQVLVEVVVAREIEGQARTVILVTGLQCVDVFGLDPRQRLTADIEDPRLVTSAVGGIDARHVRGLVSQHDARRQLVGRIVRSRNLGLNELDLVIGVLDLVMTVARARG